MFSNRMRSVFGATLLVAVCLSSAPPASAERVPLRTDVTRNSATVTFGWRDPVAYQQSLQGNRFSIRFSRNIDGPLPLALRGLGGIVENAEIAADGRTIEMTLAVPADTYAYYTGTGITVEFVKKPGAVRSSSAETRSEAESDTPKQATDTLAVSRPVGGAQSVPADAPRVGVRTGQHPEYTRVVFDFTQNTPYTLDNADGVVTIRFQATANIDTSPLNRTGVRFLGGARTQTSGGETVVTMAVPATASVRNFLSGAKVVIDIRQPSGPETPVALPPEAAIVAESGPTPQPEAPAPDPQPVQPVEQVSAPPSPPAPAAEQQPEPETTTEAAEAGSAPDPDSSRPRALTPTGAQPAPTQPQAVDEALSARAAAPVSDGPADAASVQAFPGDDALAFRFDFDEPVAAATFRRGGAVWIVFDKPTIVDTAALKVAAGEAAFEILQLEKRDATILRIRTSRRYNPSVQRDGLAWIIDLAPRNLAPQAALEVNAQPNSPVGARLFVPVPEPGRPVAITDPNVGDNFVVVPVIPLGQALGRQYTYPQFNLPVAAQGVVINPLTDDLRIRALRQGIEIGSSGVQLAISNVSADAAAHAQLAASRPMVRALEDLAQYYTPIKQFREMRQDMESEVASAPENRRAAPRLELAKFFFANGFAPETLGVIKVAIEDIPLLEDDPSVRIMRGGSNYLLGRYQDALADLTHTSVSGNDEARLWAAATTAMLGDRLGSARDLRFTGSIARDYPRPLKMPLGTLIAEVAAETGDGQGARLFLEALNLEDPTRYEADMLKFAEGKLNELDGEFENSIAIWEEILESESRLARARARVSLTEMLLKLRRISEVEAIEEYEKLRFAWRGDQMEFNNLRRLGSLYLDAGFFRSGLSTLKEAATHFRDFEEAPEITKQMSDTFNALFLGEESEALDPVKAIAIYNEFKELTPAGALGDEMIRNLADKLVQVDLLERAANLLSAQVQFRLQGEQKARVGARLALIFTLAQNYEQAFEVLQSTNESNLSPELTAQRRHLLGQVLIGLKRNSDALVLLEEDESEPAELLRAEIFWRAGDWLQASSSYRLLVRLSGADPDADLTNSQAARILNYAVALTNSGGERAISQLKQEYGFQMAQTGFAEAFSLVTSPSSPGVLPPTAVTGRVQEAETFLTAYRSKLKDGTPLSSIN